MYDHASMNRVFRVVWNATLGVWQAVGEIGKGAGKGTSDSRKKRHSAVLAGTVFLVSSSVYSAALPQGGVISSGSGSIVQQSTNTLNITQNSNKMAIDWQSFNIGKDSSVNFIQPSSSSIALNRVTGTDVSSIQGAINANGQVFLINPNGVVFSTTAQVNVGGLVASTRNLTNEQFNAGKFRFDGTTSNAIINQGNIVAKDGGYVVMIAAKIENSGKITANQGTVGLVTGNLMTVDMGGPVKIKVEQRAVDALIENGGAIQADGGHILLTAKSAGDLAASVINNKGELRARSLADLMGQVDVVAEGGSVNHSGTIDVSSDVGNAGQAVVTAKEVALTDTAQINANGKSGGGEVLVGGDWQGSGDTYQATKVSMASGAKISASATDKGDGGKVVVWSDVHNVDSVTDVHGSITAKGGVNGGDGGKIETSGHLLKIYSSVDVNTNGGLWLLDPTDVTIDSGSGAIGNSNVGGGVIGSALASNSVQIDATNDITIASDITATANNNNTLTLKAGRNILQNAGITVDTKGGNVVYWSDSDANSKGRIMLYGGSDSSHKTTITTSGGAITLSGGSDIATGYASSDGTDTASSGNPEAFGINLDGQISLNAGSGAITLRGKSSSTVGSYVAGVRAYSGVSMVGGDIAISGQTSSSDNNGDNWGVGLVWGVTVTSSGTLSISGSNSGNRYTRGVDLEGATLTSAGNMTVTGSGSSGSSQNYNYGVYIGGSSTLSTTGSATLSVTGTGGGSSTDNNDGIKVDGSTIKTVSGLLTLQGTRGGTGNNSEGISLDNASTFGQSSQTGNIKLIADIYYSNAASGKPSTFTGSGALTIEPLSASFGRTFDLTGGYILSNTLTGLTIGKSTNTADITLSTAETLAGPITVYGGLININSGVNLNSSAGNGNITLTASTGIDLKKAVHSLTSGSGNITLITPIIYGDNFGDDSSGNYIGGKFSITSTGEFTLKPYATNFNGYFMNNLVTAGGQFELDGALSNNTFTGTANSDAGWLVINNVSGLTGFTYGKDGLTQAILTNTAWTINGLISIISGQITLGGNLTSTASNAAILLKSTGNVIQNSGISVTTNGGNVTYWSDSDGDHKGRIELVAGTSGANTSITTSGGAITLSGGSDLTTGYAWSDGTDTATSGNTQVHGINIDGYSVLNAGAGDITLRGKSSASADLYILGTRIFGTGASVSGKNITIVGDASTAVSQNNKGAWGTGILYGASVSGSGTIDITGTGGSTSSSSQNNYGINYVGGSIIGTGSGAVTLTGTGGGNSSSSNNDGINANGSANSLIKTASGNLTLIGTAGSGSQGEGIALEQGTLGSDSGQSGNMTLRADSIYFNLSQNIKTTGTLTLESAGATFSTAFSTSGLVLGSSISGLTIGKSTNTANITIGSTASIAGPITVYGSTINLNADITSTATTGTGVSLTGTNIVQASGVDVATSGANITYSVTNAPWTTGNDYGINLSGASGSGVTINAGGGNITLSSSFASSGSVDTTGTMDRAISGSYSTISTTGSGTISITGDATNNANTSTTAWGMTFINTSTIQSVNGAITLTGTGGKASANSRGIAVDGQLFKVLSSTGAITLNDQKASGLTGTYLGMYLNPTSTQHMFFGADGSTVASSSSNVTLTADKLSFLVNSGYSPKINTSGNIVIQSESTAFASALDTTNLVVSGNPSSVTIGKSTNTADITIGGAISAAGAISIYGGAITLNAGLTATGTNTISLYASGNVTDGASGYVSADKLLLSGGAVTLDNASNAIGTLAATGVSTLTYVDSNALTIGTVGSTDGVSATGAVAIGTLTGDLTVSKNIATTNTTASALALNAGISTAAGTSTGGNILLSGSPTISVGANGTAKLYTGSVSGSTGITTLVGSGSGNFRYNADENTNFAIGSWINLGASGTYAIYREQPTANITNMTLTMTYGDSLPTITATGAVNGDGSSYAITSAAYSNASKLKVSGSPYTITSSLAGLGYNVTGVSSGTLTVNTKALDISGLSVTSRAYNGTTTATLSGTEALTNGATTTSDNKYYTADTVSLTGTAAGVYADKDVGTAKTVTVSGLSLTGADAANYSLNSLTLTGDVTKKTVTLSASKTYDGTTTLGASDVTITTGVGTETLTYSGATVNNAHVATAGKYINAITLGDGGNGGVTSNYQLPSLTTSSANNGVTITAATLTPTLTNTGVTKTYDGTTNAPSGFTPTWSYSGFVSGDTAATLSYTGAVYDHADATGVNAATKVTVSGITIASITGSNNSTVSDYSVAATKDVSAGITKAALTVTANNDSRFYSQTDNSSYAGVSYSGFVNGETSAALGGSLAIARSDSANNNAGSYTLTPSGLTSANYNITFATTGTYTIIPANQLQVIVADQSLTYGATPSYTITSAKYLQSDNSTITDLSGSLTSNGSNSFTVDGVTFTISATGASNSTAGLIKVGSYQTSSSITGGTSSNFTSLVTTGALAITEKSLTPTASGVSKTYDGTTSMTGVTVGLTGKETNDVVTVSGLGAFSSKIVGTGLSYTLSNLELSGTDAGNYYLSSGATLSGNDGVITAKDITAITGITATNKTYDGSTVATLNTSGVSFTGMITGDALAVATSSGAFSDKNVGTGKTVSITGLTLGGADASNYNLTVAGQSASTTANISQLSSVTWIGGATGNWFDPANWAGGAVPDLSNVANVVIPSNVTVTFDTTGAVSPADASQAVNITSLGSAGSLAQTNGTLNIGSGGLTLAGFSQTGGTTSVTGDFTTTDSFSQGTSGSVTVGGNTSITDTTGGTTIGNLNTTGTTSITSTGGDITQANGTTLVSGGSTTLNATSGGSDANISLTNANNDFQSTVSATGNDISLTDTNALTVALNASGNSTLNAGGNLAVSGTTDDLTTTTTNGGTTSFGTTTVSGNLSTTSDGDISQTGALSVTGTTTLSAGTNSITLNNATNNFQDTVNATGNNVALTDGMGGLVLGNITTTGTLGATSTGGDITQANATALSAGGVTTLNAGTNDISLMNVNNDFQSTVNAIGNDINLTDTNALTVALTATGNSTLNAGGNLAVSGTTDDLTTTTTNGGTTSFGTTTVSGNLSTTSDGNVSQTGALGVTGTSTLNAGNHDITLTTASNNFHSSVSATGRDLSIKDVSSLTVALAASGNSTLSAGGNLNISGSTNNLTTTTTNGGTTTFGATTVNGNLDVNSAGTITEGNGLIIVGSKDFHTDGSSSGGGSSGGSTPTPTVAPTEAPTSAPTEAPTEQPTIAPTEAPTSAPTEAPTQEPTTVAITDASIGLVNQVPYQSTTMTPNSLPSTMLSSVISGVSSLNLGVSTGGTEMSNSSSGDSTSSLLNSQIGQSGVSSSLVFVKASATETTSDDNNVATSQSGGLDPSGYMKVVVLQGGINLGKLLHEAPDNTTMVTQ